MEPVSSVLSLFERPPEFSPLGTGEHGVGVGKRQYLKQELGEGTIDLMKTIKKTVDPTGMMNPGKVSFF
jgi:D-lactate dehydrogenase (cytochrome)